MCPQSELGCTTVRITTYISCLQLSVCKSHKLYTETKLYQMEIIRLVLYLMDLNSKQHLLL